MMKIKIVMYSLFLPAFMLLSCGNSPEEAKKYDQAIISGQVAVNGKIEALLESFKEAEPGKMDSAYADAVLQLEAAMDTLLNMNAFKGGSDLRESALTLFGVYRSVLDNEFREIITVLKLPDDQYTKENEEHCVALRDTIVKQIDAAFSGFSYAHKQFLKQHKIELTD
jgi:hypothetical protein